MQTRMHTDSNLFCSAEISQKILVILYFKLEPKKETAGRASVIEQQTQHFFIALLASCSVDEPTNQRTPTCESERGFDATRPSSYEACFLSEL